MGGPSWQVQPSASTNTHPLGPCEAELDEQCAAVRPGEGRLFACLVGALKDASSPEPADANAGLPRLQPSAKCGEEMLRFAVARSKNVNKDVPLAEACKQVREGGWFWGGVSGRRLGGASRAAPTPPHPTPTLTTQSSASQDIEKQCANLGGSVTVLGCLREVGTAKLAPSCAAVVKARQEDAAAEWGADAELAAACDVDVKSLCAAAGPGAGAVGECLRSNEGRLSWECRDQVFRQDVENAGDIRLSIKARAGEAAGLGGLWRASRQHGQWPPTRPPRPNPSLTILTIIRTH